MKKRTITPLGVAFVALLLLVVVFLARISLHRPTHVVLPEETTADETSDGASDTGQEALRRIEVTPETVQAVIARLERPESYSRVITIERYWAGGSGVSTVRVRAAKGWMRVDTLAENDEETRGVITGEGKCWIWYGGREPVYIGAAALSDDEEQSIPTYEDILAFSTDRIAAADYRILDTTECIYVETVPDAWGYVERWWVGVGNGLLVAAERVNGEDVVYRMAGLDAETGGATAEAFMLPDGEILFDPEAEEEADTANEG